jgi:hypothetical protein
MSATFRHRGLLYQKDAPFDRDEGAGTLAVDTVLDDVTVPVGSAICRDIDFGYVVAQLSRPTAMLDVRLPAGTSLHLYEANPRGISGWLLLALLGPLLVVLILVWLIPVAVSEIASGQWPTRDTSPPCPTGPIRAIAYLASPMTLFGQELVKGDSIAFYRSGMIEPRTSASS